MSRGGRNTPINDNQGERGKRLKQDPLEEKKVEEEGQLQICKSEGNRGWKEETEIRKGLRIGEGRRAFSKLLREQAAEDRRRVEIQRKLQRVIINTSLIALGFGLGWILHWGSPSLAICQCL